MESHGSERRRKLKRKPLADLTNVAPFVFSSSSTPSLRKSIPKPKPKPKPPQSSNPEERSNPVVNSRRHEDHGDQIVATPSPKSRGTFLDSVDDAAQRDKSKHSIVYTRQATEGRRSNGKEAGRRCKEKEAGRCKEKDTPSTALSCPPAASDRSMRGKLVMEDGKVDHPKALSVPYQKAKKQQRRYRVPEAISKPILPQDFIEEQRTYFAEIDAFELPEEVVSESELE